MSDLELTREAPSYTSMTLARFREEGYAAADLYFVLGADAFLSIETWNGYPAILDAANFAVVSRPGSSVEEVARKLPYLEQRMALPAGPAVRGAPRIILIDAGTADVSSTAIRARCAEGQAIDGLVPAPVERYIARHQLYSPAGQTDAGHTRPRTRTAGSLHGTE